MPAVDHQPAPSAPPPPAYPAPPPAPWNGKTNGFAIAALTLSLFGCVGPVSIVFAILALRQTGRNGDRRGSFYAVASLVVCGLWVLALVVGVAVNLAKGPDRDAAGAVQGARSISLESLRPGDCVKDVVARTSTAVTVVPCTSHHNGEVIGRLTLPTGAWPGAEQLQETAHAGCDKLFVEYAGVTRDDATYAMLTVVPDEQDWPGERGVLCLANHLRTSVTYSARR